MPFLLLSDITLKFFDNLSNYFTTWREVFVKYQKMVKETELSLLQYALNYVLNIKEIDKVLVGVLSETQLLEIIQAEKRSLNLSAYPVRDENLLNPSLWN